MHWLALHVHCELVTQISHVRWVKDMASRAGRSGGEQNRSSDGMKEAASSPQHATDALQVVVHRVDGLALACLHVSSSGCFMAPQTGTDANTRDISTKYWQGKLSC